MKSRLFLISGILLMFRLSACGCGWPEPLNPQWHWFFYTGYESADNDWQEKLNKAFREENVVFWYNRVQKKVPRKAVETALYDVYLLNEQTDDPFFRYLIDHQDTVALKYWMLLKTSDSEYVRQAEWEQSVWFYSEKTGERYWWEYEENMPNHDLSISQVMDMDESAIISCKDKDMLNRFLLQVIRRCFYARDYQGCITLWERYGKEVPKSVLRKQCMNYLGGALRRLDRDAEAAIVYAEIGYYAPRLHYSVDVLRNIYKQDPDSKAFEFMVQQFVNTYFDKCFHVSYDVPSSYSGPRYYQIPDMDKTKAFNALAEEILREGKNRNPALWKSAQAALAYLNGDTASAIRLITAADKLRGTQAVKDNIRMMRLMFNSMRNDNGANYEATLLPDLQWLVDHIGLDKSYYWIDFDLAGETSDCYTPTAILHYIKILRRTVLLGIVPHFDRRGMAYKSIAYLNLYENLMKDGDYRSLHFVYMDTTSLANVQRYDRFMRGGGRTAAEKFLIQHSRWDPNLVNELIATKYMREEKYDSALVYLRTVPTSFSRKLNVSYCICGGYRNAFVEGWIKTPAYKAKFGLPFNPAAEYESNPSKITFCQLMLRLSKLAESDPSEEIRAKAAYAYAVGYFRSTIGSAWALNYYEYGWNDGRHDGKGVPGYDAELEAVAENRADRWLDKALQYDGDDIFTMKCTILHSKKKSSLMKTVVKTYNWTSWTDTIRVFVQEVRATFCDLGCDGDPLCTEEWRESAWYY